MKLATMPNDTLTERGVSASDVALVLGGSVRSVKDENTLDGLVRSGLPASVLTALRKVGFTIDELREATSLSASTINRLCSGDKGPGTLSLSASDRAVRLARTYILATRLIGSNRAALSWMRTGHRYLNERTPLESISTDFGLARVNESLYAIAYGGPG